MPEHCPTCVCGLTEVEYSDRRVWVNFADSDAVVRFIIDWAGDHYYDRGEQLPLYSLFDHKRVDLLQLAVDTYLDTEFPEWRAETIDLTGYQESQFEKRLKEALRHVDLSPTIPA